MKGSYFLYEIIHLVRQKQKTTTSLLSAYLLLPASAPKLLFVIIGNGKWGDIMEFQLGACLLTTLFLSLPLRWRKV